MLGQVWEVPCPVWHGLVPGDEGRVSEQAEGEDAPQLYACYGTGLSSTGPKGAGLPLGNSQKIFLLQACKVSFAYMSIFGFLPSCNSQKPII